ncbi:phage tail-collar fiber domain-containing protein [Stutzerimonas kunmingensis]|uniref:phage tail-collar fiber domain-containing protein n=1 Tax=Stutzerimonas kunmingensis TaxID=1211807 RepID=UPI00241EBE2D|nr:phage tail protein [Stutzerimonas kunmingensis]
MGASITIAGERLIAQKQADRQPLEVARFVLAYLPGLDTTQPVDREAGLPPAEQIVYSVDISRDGAAGPNGELTREGYLSPNQVVYSLLMGTNIGDFDFNWIGLQTTEDVLLIAAYVPRQQKRRELPPLQTGNNLTRNIVLEYDGAQSLTGIDVPAASWQFDFTAQFAAMNTQIAALQAELEKKVDAASWNPPQSVSLDGPVLVYPGSSNTYQITDFDAFAVYQASSTVGSVTLAGDEMTLDVPAEAPEGVATLEVRRGAAKATFKVPVGSAAIDQPVILSPTAGATNVTFEPDLAASPFVAYPAGYDSHAATRWQVARDTGFTDLVFDQQGADNLTAISLAAAGARLDPATRYYVRVQYHGATLVSAWSSAVAFNTATIYIRKPTVTSPLDGAVNVSTGLTVIADAFSVSGGADTHESSRWQVSTVADFSTVVVDSGWSVSQLTSYKPAGLTMETAYFVRVKYRGAQVGESEWSSVIGFVTAPQLQGTYTRLASGPSITNFAMLAEVDGVLYLTGGHQEMETWKFTPSLNQWVQLANAPAATYSSKAVAVIGTDIYVVSAASYYGAVTLRKYNTLTNVWASLGEAPGGYTYQSLQAIGGKLYLFGGKGSWSSNTGTRSLYEYNPATAAWTAKTSPPNGTERYDAASAVLDGKLYIAGGIWDGGSGSTAKKDVWSYDPGTDKWTQRASMPWQKYLAAGAAVNGRFYVDGGNNADGSYGGSLLMYDPAANTWTEIPNNRRTENRRDHAAVGLASNMYVYTGSFFRVD